MSAGRALLPGVALGQVSNSWDTQKRVPKGLTAMIHRSHGLNTVMAVNIRLWRLLRSQLVFIESKLSEVKRSLLVRKIVL